MNQSKWRNFIVGAMLHEGVRQEGDKYIISISDLNFDLLKDAFPTKYQNFKDSDVRPMFKDPIYLPQGDGSSKGIIDNVALEDYKDYIMSRVGNVDIILDPTTNRATIEDPKYKKREAGIGKDIMSYYDDTERYQGD
tara:strand:- start:196 stop:606 length:411 start_codon:yes stop_codon:yes gene_type:complete